MLVAATENRLLSLTELFKPQLRENFMRLTWTTFVERPRKRRLKTAPRRKPAPAYCKSTAKVQLEKQGETKTNKWKTKISPGSRVLACSMYSSSHIGPRVMNVHIGSIVYHTRKRQAKLVSVNQQPATYYASLAAAISSSDSAVHGGQHRVRN